jgi:Xaa-Pro aminopeptidase
MTDHHLKRLEKTKRFLKDVDGFLVTDIHNVRYLSGFTGSSGVLLITKSNNIFLTDFRYREQAEKEVAGCDIVIENKGRLAVIRHLLKKLGIKKLGVESSVSYEFFKKLSVFCSPKAFRNAVEKLREVKDGAEINCIKEAVRRAEAAFLEVKPYIRAGVKERAIALRLEERLKRKGCRRIPFDIIVASGQNSAMPHAVATEKRLEAGDLVVIDWGGESDGYFSDMTRTLLIKGKDLGRKKEIYRLVLEANRKGISAVREGAEFREIDNSARDIIKQAGYGKYFGHAVGHGVGLQIHELPRVTWKRKGRIKKGMVFTVEPGVYIPGLGGVRIEDMVVVGGQEADLLTSLPKKLEIVS